MPGVAGGYHADTFCTDETLVGFHTDAHAVFLAKADDFGLLNQVNAQCVCRTGETPGHRIVTSDTTTALNCRADDRVTGVFRAVQVRDFLGDLLAVEQFAVHTVKPVGADTALGVAHVLQGVAQVVYAALGEHDVVVQVLGQAFPQFHRVFIKVGRFVPQVVGAHDGGVTRGIAAAQPAFFDHGHIGNAVLLGQIIGRRQTVPAAADDDHVIDLFRGGRAPHALPVFMVAEGMLEKAEA